MPRPCPPADHVQLLVEGWRRERPDLPVEPLEVVYRIGRLAAHLAAEVDRAFAGTPVSQADFAVLANLRRAGAPFELPQRRLMEALGLTSGTVSVRIDRLARLGLVERRPDPGDGRGVVVALTTRGSEVFEEVAPRHLANEARLVAALAPDERAELARLLQVLLVEHEPLEDPGRPLGLAVLPAHEGLARRAAVGLAPVEGLLVDAVVPGGPGAAADLRPGDVLTRAGGRPLRSLSDLAAATRRRTRTTVGYLRGGRVAQAVLALRRP